MRDAFLAGARDAGPDPRGRFYKTEREIASPQAADVRLAGGAGVLNSARTTIWVWRTIRA